ncbi:hypothetical protein ACSL9C_000843 [Vibrio navarrensis]|uniref:hypothetical protein n=1 Tax=Vibrio navarrensis TaxID=29495 RepID=UPI00186A9E04|nr:hypothetical protein [Vibrio navarrensis]MBE4618287.1 hypothetical protein [Vibrio navarrensis]
MTRLPAFSFSVSESGQRGAASHWPDTQNFPQVTAHPIFSIASYLPRAWPRLVFVLELPATSQKQPPVVH